MHYTRISTYEMTNGTFPELTRLAEKGILPKFAKEPGFVNYGLVDVGDHKVVCDQHLGDPREPLRSRPQSPTVGQGQHRQPSPAADDTDR